MAVNLPRYYAIGVAAPLPNHLFRTGKSFSTVLDSGVTSQDSTFDVTDVADDFGIMLGAGAKIQLGPSTHADNPETYEQITVASAVSNSPSSGKARITPKGSTLPIFNYSAGDPVTGIATNFPEDWDITLPGNLLQITTRPLWSQVEGDDGVADHYRVYLSATESLGTAAYFLLTHTAGKAVLIPNTYYRAGYYYKVTFGSSHYNNHIGILINDGVSNILGAVARYGTGGSTTVWTPYFSDDIYVSSTSDDFSFGLYGQVQNTTNVYQWDMPFMTHAKGTSADNAILPAGQASRGMYLFTEQPDLESSSFSFRTFDKITLSATGDQYRTLQNKRRTSKITFRCTFSNVSAEFLQNLRVLEQWQNLGHKLIFFTFAKTEDVEEKVPPYLLGYMTISNIVKNLWDRSRTDFTFEFVESE